MADPESRPRPFQLTLAAALAALEGLVALGFGAFEVGQVQPARVGLGIGVALLMLAFAALLLAAARALLRARRWARGPVVALQLILLPVGWSFRGGQTTWVAVVMITAAVLTLLMILHPSVTRTLVQDEGGNPSSSS